uniref:DUF676 domain-containing protein n=1 Tax=Macrostomum lignano TaxID=282301 RepID=A0A1I8FB11_9PLAT
MNTAVMDVDSKRRGQGPASASMAGCWPAPGPCVCLLGRGGELSQPHLPAALRLPTLCSCLASSTPKPGSLVEVVGSALFDKLCSQCSTWCSWTEGCSENFDMDMYNKAVQILQQPSRPVVGLSTAAAKCQRAVPDYAAVQPPQVAVSVQTVRINLRDEDSEAVLASSLEWLHNRVELLLSLAPGESPSQPEVLPRFTASRLSALSIPGVGGGGGGGGMLPGFRPMTERQVLQKRRRCMLLMLKLLKRLQSATRCLDSAIRLVSDEVFCRLLPLAICANFYDMPPACEIILAKTLANLSCHRGRLFHVLHFVCNLVDGWSESSCLALGLCGRKICANLSTYALLNALATDSSYRPHCIYQPDRVLHVETGRLSGFIGFGGWRTAAVKSDSNSENDAPQVTECWPRDWLAEDMPRARVLVLVSSNNANPARTPRSAEHENRRHEVARLRQTGDSSGLLPRRANEAANQLLAAGVGNRMTAFVCHSFGGLIVKQMMQVLNSSEDRLRKRLLASIRGVVFIAVPHLRAQQGGEREQNLLAAAPPALPVRGGQVRIRWQLQRAQHLHAWFVQYAQTRPDMRVLNIIELSRTPVAPGGIGLKVCPESWADK